MLDQVSGVMTLAIVEDRMEQPLPQQCEGCPWGIELPLSQQTLPLGWETHSGRLGRRRVPSLQVSFGGSTLQEHIVFVPRLYCLSCRGHALGSSLPPLPSTAIKREQSWFSERGNKYETVHSWSKNCTFAIVWITWMNIFRLVSMNSKVDKWVGRENMTKNILSECSNLSDKKKVCMFLWGQVYPRRRLLTECCVQWETSVNGKSQWEPLVLGDLCRLSIWDVAGVLFFLLFFFLLTDQELLWRPAELPTLHFSLRRLHHNGWQAIFELAAAVKVWRVREYLKRRHNNKLKLGFIYLSRGILVLSPH